MGYLHPSSIFSGRKEKRKGKEGVEVNEKKTEALNRQPKSTHPVHVLLYILMIVDFRLVFNSMILSP